MTDEAPAPSITINYTKSSAFREVACDGVIGSITPHEKLWFAFFNERTAIPQVVLHQLVPADQPGEFHIEPNDPGLPVEGKSGIIRNMEVGIYMSVSTATDFHRWLGEQLASLRGESGK